MAIVTLAFDTNFLQAFFQSNHLHHGQAIDLMVQHADSPIVLCPMVFSEALCIPDMTLAELQLICSDFGIAVDWQMPPEVWYQAGLARARRLKFQVMPTEPKRIIADFLIGSHALVRDYHLCTFNPKDFRTSLPNLRLLP